MLSPPLLNVPTSNSIQSSTTQSPSVGGSAVHERSPTDEDDELDISPGALQDLGRLGEGASGEVRKVLHKPTGLVMAKKVSFLSTVSLRPNHLSIVAAVDDHDFTESETSQATLERTIFHEGLYGSSHCTILRSIPRICESRDRQSCAHC